MTANVKKQAMRVEKEILGADSKGNVHLAEERHQRLQHDEDETERYEEMKYSGVYRSKTNGASNGGGYQKGTYVKQQKPTEVATSAPVAFSSKFVMRTKQAVPSLMGAMLENFLKIKQDGPKTLVVPWKGQEGRSLEKESKAL